MEEKKVKLSHNEAMASLSKVSPKSILKYIGLHRCSADQFVHSEENEKAEFAGQLETYFKSLGDGVYACMVEYTELDPPKPKPEGDGVFMNGTKIRAGIEAQYEIDDKEFELNEVEAFVRTSSVFHTWPYWREFLASMHGRMGSVDIPITKALPIPLAAEFAGYKVESDGSIED